MKRLPNVEAIRARIRPAGEKPPRRHALICPENYPSTPGNKRYEADRRGYSAGGGERWVADQRLADQNAAKSFRHTPRP